MDDLDADLSAALGQPVTLTWLATQVANWTAAPGGQAATALSPIEQLELNEARPDKYVLYCPTYFIPHGAGPPPFQSIHMEAYGVRLRDEYAAKARAKLDATGTFSPLRPVSIQQAGEAILIRFKGQVGPLRWNIYDPVGNPNGVVDPGHYGFELSDPGGAAIAAVSIEGDQVRLITDKPVTPGYGVAYALTGVVGNFPGPVTGPRGCLSDSDPTPPSSTLQTHRQIVLGQSQAAKSAPLCNWCVAFQQYGM